MTGSLVALELPRTLFATDAVSALAAEAAALGMRRPLLVTDHGLVAAGVVGRLQWGASLSATVFDSVSENPVFADADRGAAMYRHGRCDGVVALGGGSVIDTAKYIALLATNPGSVGDYAGVDGASVSPTAPLIVLPTTAGTGSEANATAGIHPTADKPAVGVASRHLLADLVICDPTLTISLPPRLTAATGVDALTHCIEGYLSRNRHRVAEAFALDGVARVMAWVRRAVLAGDDLEARSQMMVAAYSGGVAIQLGLGPAHAIAITCGDRGFHHGILSGIGVIAAVDTMAAKQPERADDLRRAMGLPEGASIGAAVASLMRELSLPTSLRELNYGAADADALGEIAHHSFFNASAYYHPSRGDYADMIRTSLS